MRPPATNLVVNLVNSRDFAALRRIHEQHPGFLKDLKIKEIHGGNLLHLVAIVGDNDIKMTKFFVETVGCDWNFLDTRGDTPVVNAALFGLGKMVIYYLDKIGAPLPSVRKIPHGYLCEIDEWRSGTHASQVKKRKCVEQILACVMPPELTQLTIEML